MDGRTTGDLIERKYFAHYVDSNMSNGVATAYQRIGKDLEEYNIEMNAETETKSNILGESVSRIKGYKPVASVGTNYAYEGDALYTALFSIINNRSTGSDLETTVVDVVLDKDGSVDSAYREDVVLVPQSVGGGTEGMQIPYEIQYSGNRVSGTWTVATSTFTPAT